MKSLLLLLSFFLYFLSAPAIPKQKTLDLYAQLPRKTLLTQRQVAMAHLRFGTFAEMGDYKACLSAIRSENWIKSQDADLVEPLSQLNATLVVVSEALASIDGILGTLQFLPSWLKDTDIPDATCENDLSFFGDLPVRTLSETCDHIKQKIHEPSTNKALFKEYIKSGNVLLDTYELHLSYFKTQLLQIFQRVNQFRSHKFPASLEWMLSNCTDAVFTRTTIRGCKATAKDIICAVQIDEYSTPVQVFPLYPIAYDGFQAELPFLNTAVHEDSLALMDLDTCVALSSRHLYCTHLEYVQYPCYTSAFNGQLSSILRDCSFTKPLDHNTLPVETRSNFVLFDKLSGKGQLKVSNLVMSDRPLAVRGYEVNYKALATKLTYIVGGDTTLAITRFTKAEVTAMQKSINIYKQYFKVYLPNIIVSSSISVTCSLLLMFSFICYLKCCFSKSNPDTAKKARENEGSAIRSPRELEQLIRNHRV